MARIGETFGSNFLVYDKSLCGSDWNSMVMIDPQWRTTGEKYNTLFINNLPASWFNLTSLSTDWTVLPGTQSVKSSTKTNSTISLTPSETVNPFIGAMTKLFGAFGPIKNIVAIPLIDQNTAPSSSSTTVSSTFVPPPTSSDNRPHSPMLDRWLKDSTTLASSILPRSSSSSAAAVAPVPALPNARHKKPALEPPSALDAGFDPEDDPNADDAGSALALFERGSDTPRAAVSEDLPSSTLPVGVDRELRLEAKIPVTEMHPADEAPSVAPSSLASSTSSRPLPNPADHYKRGGGGGTRPLPPTPQGPAAASGEPPSKQPPKAGTAVGGPSLNVVPLPSHLWGGMFTVVVKFADNISFLRCCRKLGDKVLTVGDMETARNPPDEVFGVPLLLAVDRGGYFSPSQIDYRERQERTLQDETLKKQLTKARLEKKYAREARAVIKKAEDILEAAEIELNTIAGNEAVERHRPCRIAAEGAKGALELAKETLRRVKGGLLPTEEEDLKAVVKEVKSVVVKAKKGVETLSAMGDRVILEKSLALPNLEQALKANNCNMFLERLKQSGYFLKSKELTGVTILAPDDEAFLGDDLDMFEESCFGAHIIDGPYFCGDLLNLNSGYTQPRSAEPRHAIRTRMDLGGVFTFWLCGDSEPRRKANCIKGDIPFSGGSLIHVVDKILFPDDVQAS